LTLVAADSYNGSRVLTVEASHRTRQRRSAAGDRIFSHRARFQPGAERRIGE